MSNVQKIEDEIKQLAPDELAPDELARFRDWFEKFDSENWDKQLEKDINAGKLDNLAEKAIQDFKNGKYKKI